MKKNKYLLIICFLFFLNNAASQCNGRYMNEIFSNVDVSTTSYSDIFFDSEHEMDVYTPVGDSLQNRPLILYFHGGSFTAGDKSTIDCVDFCEYFSKRGYVTASVNYRLSNILTFFLSTNAQIDAVLKSLADARAAIRFFKESYINGNPYGIDTSAIFIGGYSAGGVIAIHHAYIDNEQELPQNILSRLSSIGGTLEGDAGNFGFSSKINGVINFAGGIHDLGWINSAEEPIVSVHGDLDLVVNYNCSPALNNPALLNLCGSNEIHMKANNQGLNNQLLELNFTNHEWAQFGVVNPKFIQGLEFSRDFIYNLLPCNQSLGTDNNFKDIFVISYDNNVQELKINISSSFNGEPAFIYDVSGNYVQKITLSENSNSKNIKLNKLASGMYIISIGSKGAKFIKY
ncbi:carboxylesterase family protein [Bacteroidota bacterium]|nr:carboxylesterase family protein [Bacteroidota bacterium]